jgi:protein gp37
MVWSNDAMAVAQRLKAMTKPAHAGAAAQTGGRNKTSVWQKLFGKKP